MPLALKATLLAVIAAVVVPCIAAEVEFEALPSQVVYIDEAKTTEATLSSKQATEARVRIIRTETGYIWETRKNLLLEKSESGVYITYTALNGAGYVRVINPAMRSMLQSLPPTQREKEFAYMEHLVNRLGSITYFGK